MDIPNIDLRDYIDPAIVDIIAAINRLSFVRRTLWCCAGYGPHPPIAVIWLPDFEHAAIRLNTLRTHCKPYVVIEYLRTTDFHKELAALCHRVRPAKVPNAFMYSILAPGIYPNIEKTIAEKWDKVRELIIRYKQKDGVR